MQISLLEFIDTCYSGKESTNLGVLNVTWHQSMHLCIFNKFSGESPNGEGGSWHGLFGDVGGLQI